MAAYGPKSTVITTPAISIFGVFSRSFEPTSYFLMEIVIWFGPLKLVGGDSLL